MGAHGNAAQDNGSAMRLSGTGTIHVGGFLIRSTVEGWTVSIKGTEVGRAPSLPEAEQLITDHLEEVRQNLARINREHEERLKAEREECRRIADATKH